MTTLPTPDKRVRIGYARVSTEEQTVALQLDCLKAAGCEKIFWDKGVSGATTRRDGLDAALGALRPGDTLVVWKLDRLGRSLKFLVDLIEDMNAMGFGFISLTDGIDTTTLAGEVVYQIVAVIAQFERKLISERTKAGMLAAKSRGKRIGRPPKLKPEDVLKAHRQIRQDGRSVEEIAERCGVSSSTVSRAIRRMELEEA